MAERTTYHVVPRETGWAVEREGATQASSLHMTHEQAVAQGQTYAKNQPPGHLIVHDEHGVILYHEAYDA